MHKFSTNTTNEETWLTPLPIIRSLGEFDLDPCSPIGRPWDTAKHHLTKEDDGLATPWFGRVWMNPPYGRAVNQWLDKLSKYKNGTALIFARTDTDAFHELVYERADSILYIRGRLFFHANRVIDHKRCLTHPHEWVPYTGKTKICKWCGVAKHNSGAPSALVSYDEFNSQMMAQSGIEGHHDYLNAGVLIIGIGKTDKTWKVIVGEAINEFGKEAKLTDIYDKVVEMAPDRVKQNKNYKAKVRQILQYHFEKLEDQKWKLCQNTE